jgi:hypothetical protein
VLKSLSQEIIVTATVITENILRKLFFIVENPFIIRDF